MQWITDQRPDQPQPNQQVECDRRHPVEASVAMLQIEKRAGKGQTGTEEQEDGPRLHPVLPGWPVGKPERECVVVIGRIHQQECRQIADIGQLVGLPGAHIQQQVVEQHRENRAIDQTTENAIDHLRIEELPFAHQIDRDNKWIGRLHAQIDCRTPRFEVVTHIR